MRREKFTFARLAIMVALTFAFAGALATPAAAQTTTFDGPCQFVGAGQIERNCVFVVDSAGECSVSVDGSTFQEVNASGEQCRIIQGTCPFQTILEDNTIIQIICDDAGDLATSTPTATNTPVPATNTPVPATNTPVPATNTPVPATNTPVPPTATATPVTPGVTPTATPTQGIETPTATATATVPGDDDDDDVVPPGDDDDDNGGGQADPPAGGQADPPAGDAADEVVVDALPSTGQGATDTNQSGIVIAMLGAMSALLAGAALLWQRRSIA